MEQSVSAKVQEYETFLNDTLKEDLKLLESELKGKNEKITNWYLLQKTIADIREHHPKGFKTQVDVGCGILCEAKVPDASIININVGLNVYLPLTLDDAHKFCDVRINLLKQEIEYIQNQAIKVKAHIKLVLLGLQELQKV